MAIRYIPAKRFIDTFERVTNEVMDLLGRGGRAIVEPETVRVADLNPVYAKAQIQAMVVGAHGDLIFGADFIIPHGETLVVPDGVFFPTMTSIDTVVWIEQKHASVIFNPFVRINQSDVDGSNPFEAKFIAMNHGIVDVTIPAGTSYAVYAFYQQGGQSQSNSPSAELEVDPGLKWLDDNGDPLNLPLTADNLNASALPSVSIKPNSIGAMELNSADVGRMTETLSGLGRATLTVPLTVNVAHGPATVVGTLLVVGALPGVHVVQIGQVGAVPLYTGHVSATNTVTVTARNNNTTFVTVQVLAGTKLRVFVG